MFITRKHISRRTVLRAAGVSIALPLLDAMVPAATALASTAAAPKPRLGFVYFPHGAVMNRWKPEETGKSFELPQILKPLEPYKAHMTIVSGCRNKGGESSDPHGIIAGTWLSCVGPADPDRTGDRGVSADQIAAALHRALRRAHRRRRLRAGRGLRVREHGFVPYAHPAAADGAQPAQGVLPALRPGRHGRGAPAYRS
jgi:hypothetical protein